MSNNNSTSGGIGISGLLGAIFVILKLCGVIDWPWWWVTCPFWGGLALLFILLIIFAFFAVINNLFDAMKNKGVK